MTTEARLVRGSGAGNTSHHIKTGANLQPTAQGEKRTAEKHVAQINAEGEMAQAI